MANTAAIQKKPANKLNFYKTPEWATQVLLKYLPLADDAIILEPSSGDGAIALPLQQRGYEVYCNDIDPTRRSHFKLDLTNELNWTKIRKSIGGWDWTIGNPPYAADPPPGKKRGEAIAHHFVKYGYEFASVGCAMLLRKSFDEPTLDRRQWLREHASELALNIKLERISFTGDGRTDSAACDWFVWVKGWDKGTQVIFEWCEE